MLIERSDKNPILKPNKDHSWEAEAVFNGCPVKSGKKTYLIYRALSLPHYHALAQKKLQVSDIGIAESTDGVTYSKSRRFVIPEEEWERFGCEDPRVTKLDGKYYIFYTALSTYPPNADGIKVGVAISKDLKIIQEKHLVTPFNAKAMALFPGKIGGKMWAILAVHTDKPPAKICLVSFKNESELWSEGFWKKWYKGFLADGGGAYSLPLQRRPEDHVEVGAAPIKTKYGWLLLYSYIKNYFSGKPIFGIEAVLLDSKNPFKIIASTKAPLLTPEEYYEKGGMVPNIVFPSGALMQGSLIHLYYGAADTTCCLAYIDSKKLFKHLKGGGAPKLIRAKQNPIISPASERAWEAKATFNPGAIYLKGKVHLVYRAMSHDNTSVFGYAVSSNGITIDRRLPEPIYSPRESFEQKLVPGGNSGCEDPRLTKIGTKIYMFYTAFDGRNPPRVALTSITEADFLKARWNWEKPVLISPPDVDDKDACVFPEKVAGKYFILHRNGHDIDFALSTTLNFDGKTWLEESRWIAPRNGMWDGRKVGIASPPIKTAKGWILLYHGVSDEDGFYRVGALLLDLKDPRKIIARSNEPLFEPEANYEKEGQISNVVFPCGSVLIGGELFVYYGGGDTTIGVATISMQKLLEGLS